MASLLKANTITNLAETLYIDVEDILNKTGDETIGGIKTFSSSPIVPTPTSGSQAVNKEYADTKQDKPELVTITGSATFDGTTQNINMTGIGDITLAIGDVIEVSGTTSNNKLFTVESITDNNIVVNYEHKGTSTPAPSKRLINETASNCTIKLYNRAKNAPIGQGQGWVPLKGSRPLNTAFTNNTSRAITVCAGFNTTDGVSTFTVDNIEVIKASGSLNGGSMTLLIPAGATYSLTNTGGINYYQSFSELR